MSGDLETPLTKDSALWFVIDVLENYVEDPRSENLIEKSIKLCKEALELKPKELSDEEIKECFEMKHRPIYFYLDFARAILRKASEK